MATNDRPLAATGGRILRKAYSEIPSWLGLSPRIWLIGTMICGAALMRLLPHPLNFAPIGAMALFGGAHIPHRGWALALPLGAMLLSDAALELTTGWGFHSLMPTVYGSFALIVGLGLLLRSRPGVLPLAAASVGASLSFYIITNFAVWAQFDTFPHTAAGLAACYLAALPYLWNTLAGNLFYSAVLFGGFALMGRRFSIFSKAGEAINAGGQS